MCGIFGYKGKIDEKKARTCLNTLLHRGPDSEGHYHNEKVFLGQQRLAILDLSDKGKQPMTFGDGRYWLTYNGEIYNFLELREELRSLGHQFTSESDTEVILAAFTEWREECLNKFNGMWALAIWDTKDEALFLSRDRFGKKPLFYTELPDGLAFASEMKALTPLLSEITVAEDLVKDHKNVFYYESTERCLIKEIKRLPAGHYGWVKETQLETTRWWCTLDHLVVVPETYDEQVQKFQELFLDACKLRMRSDVPIGTALSGGLDSSAVYCTLSHLSKTISDGRMSRDWQHAFCASFPDTPIDEAKWARMVAEYCGTKISIIDIRPERFLNDFYNQFYLFEELYITPHIPFMATYKAMRENGVIVTLDGHGADELFGGYPFDYLHILHDNLFNFENTKVVIDTYYDSQINDPQFSKLPPKWMFWLRHFSKNLAKHLLSRKNHHPDDNHPNWEKLDYFTQKLYISFHQTVLPTLLRNYDRYSMASGVEIRMPFLDHHIVSYAFSLSWQSKLRGGYTKAIVRDALRDLMPKEIVDRKTKVGFNAPMVNWFKGPLREFFNETLASKDFQSSKLIDPIEATKAIEKVMETPAATFHQAEHAWQLVSPYFWAKGFLEKIKNESKL